mgnify:CR=1 FL=1
MYCDRNCMVGCFNLIEKFRQACVFRYFHVRLKNELNF